MKIGDYGSQQGAARFLRYKCAQAMHDIAHDRQRFANWLTSLKGAKKLPGEECVCPFGRYVWYRIGNRVEAISVCPSSTLWRHKTLPDHPFTTMHPVWLSNLIKKIDTITIGEHLTLWDEMSPNLILEFLNNE